MAYQAEALQVTQFAVEDIAAKGTLVAATHRFNSLTFDIDPRRPTNEAKQAGNLYPVGLVPAKGSEDVTFRGDGNVQDLLYLFSCGLSLPTFAAGVAMFAPLSDEVNPINALTIEKGISGTGNAFRFGYASLISYEIDFTPDKQVAVSGKMLGQMRETGVTLTADTTTLDSALLYPTQIDVYIASTEAGLTDTENLKKPLSVKMKMDKILGDVYTLSSADASFTELVATPPNLTYEIVMPKDADTDEWLEGIGAGLDWYIRINASGSGDDAIDIRSPIQFMNPGEGSAQDVHTATFVADAIHKPDFNTDGGALTIAITSALTEL